MIFSGWLSTLNVAIYLVSAGLLELSSRRRCEVKWHCDSNDNIDSIIIDRMILIVPLAIRALRRLESVRVILSALCGSKCHLQLINVFTFRH